MAKSIVHPIINEQYKSRIECLEKLKQIKPNKIYKVFQKDNAYWLIGIPITYRNDFITFRVMASMDINELYVYDLNSDMICKPLKKKELPLYMDALYKQPLFTEILSGKWDGELLDKDEKNLKTRRI